MFFTLVVAAAEVAVGLAIIVAIFRRRQNVTADDVNVLEGLTRMNARDLLDLAWVIPALPGVRRGRAAAVRQAHRRAAAGLDRDRD